MTVSHPIGDESPEIGPCSCGSALPYSLCCGARALTGQDRPAVFADEAAADAADAAAAEWDLAITTVQALASVLPDVPVPLLGNQTPRLLYQAGPEERAAALDFVRAVSRSAQTMGVDFPEDMVAHSVASPNAPEFSAEDREKIALATFTLQLLARGVDPPAIVGGQRLFREVLRVAAPDLTDPAVCAAAVDYAVCWMHFRPEANEDAVDGTREVALLYGVDPTAVANQFAAMKRALKLVWFDPRYAVQDSEWQERLEETARALAEGEDEPDPEQ